MVCLNSQLYVSKTVSSRGYEVCGARPGRVRQHYWEKLSRIATQHCSCFMLRGWLYIFSANNQEGRGWEQVGSWLICRTSFISPKENCSLGLPLALTPSAGALILSHNHFPTINPMTLFQVPTDDDLPRHHEDQQGCHACFLIPL